MSKLIVKKMEEVTDEEIDKFKGFDRLLRDYDHNAVRKGKLLKTIVISGLLAVTTMTVTYFGLFFERKQVVTKAIVIERPVTKKTVDTNKSEKPIMPETKTQVQPKNIPIEKSPTEVSQNYIAAEPELGYPHLYNYFDNELRYPEEHRKDSINGIVTVAFVINKEGKPEQLKIQNSLGAAFDNEVMRLIEGMPKWKPATLNNKPVPSKISVPFTFSIRKMKP